MITHSLFSSFLVLVTLAAFIIILRQFTEKFKISNIYKDDVNVHNTCRRLMALPLLPLNEVEFAFEELTEQRPDVLMPLFEYFNFWMKQTSIYLWNVSDLKIRTNNNCEDEITSLCFL